MSEPKTFSVKRDHKPNLYVSGFPQDLANGTSRPFINIRIGDNAHQGEFNVLLYMDDACALAVALTDAIAHADPDLVEEAA